MTATVQLLREPIPQWATHVLELPPWASPREHGRYWHQPRSAFLRKDGVTISAQMWCGQSRHLVYGHFTDEAPEELKCGTCVGRRAGFDGVDGQVFRPVDAWAKPKWCPGQGDDNGRCFACGRRVQYRGTWNSSESPHRPGRRLLAEWDPCELHGWKHMRAYGPWRGGHIRHDRLRCSSWQCPNGPEETMS